jgi:acyl-CoA dehydrogenase
MPTSAARPAASTTVYPEVAAHPVPDRHGASLFTADPDLRALLPLYLPADLFNHLLPHLERMGALAGGVLDELANEADHAPPTLSHRTRTGLDAQRIHKHPSYVELERVAFSEFGWLPRRIAAACSAGTSRCPRREVRADLPVRAGRVRPVLPAVDDRFADAHAAQVRRSGAGRPLPAEPDHAGVRRPYQGAMFMTEQGAGSDVAATTTRAIRDGNAEGGWRLVGDKWFCSNPDAALAMVLARVEEADGSAVAGIKGVSLFLLPRTLADGSANHFRIIRLKDKLGTRSMASGEIRLEARTPTWLANWAVVSCRWPT